MVNSSAVGATCFAKNLLRETAPSDTLFNSPTINYATSSVGHLATPLEHISLVEAVPETKSPGVTSTELGSGIEQLNGGRSNDHGVESPPPPYSRRRRRSRFLREADGG